MGITLFLLIFYNNNFAQPTSTTAIVNNKERPDIYFFKEEPPIDFVPLDFKITAIGDSLTVGVGAEGNNGGYLNYIKKHLIEEKGIKSIEISNLGKAGIRSDELIKLLKTKDVQSEIQDANLILITIGGNDLMKVVTDHIIKLELTVFERELTLFKQRLRDILSTIEQYNNEASVVLIGFYNPFNEWIGQISEVQLIMEQWTNAGEEIVTEFANAYYVNVADVFATHGQDALYEDYFHPNDFGYELIGKETLDVLLANIDAILSVRKVTFHDEKN